jgi:putative transposase
MPPLSVSEEEIDAIARRPEHRTIHNGRVLVDHIEYFSHALRTLEAQGETQITVLINDLDLHSVLIQHPTEKETLILAESTDPDYTRGLTIYEHTEAKKIRKEMTLSDIDTLGKYASVISRWKILEKIQEEVLFTKRRLRKLTNGESRGIYTQRKISEIMNCINPTLQITQTKHEELYQSTELDTPADSGDGKLLDDTDSYDSIELE